MALTYCRPTDIVTDSATVSLTSGTASTVFPLTNLYDRLSHTAFKCTTGTGCIIQAAFTTARTLEGIALFNHNLQSATITVTNAAGFSEVLALTTQPADGLNLDPWESYVGLSNPTSTTWTITISGASGPVAIGELVLIQTLRTISARWAVGELEAHPSVKLQTAYGVRTKYGFGVRQRSLEAMLFSESERDDVLALQRDARGALKAFFVALESSVNDAIYADLVDDARVYVRRNQNFAEVTLRIIEQQKGLAL